MNDLTGLSINCALKLAQIGTITVPCRIGKDGFIDEKRGTEGDSKTPLGNYNLRWGFYRADRLPHPYTHNIQPLTWRNLQPTDGWCDGLKSAAYNRFIRLPSNESHEKLWRDDGAYDIILVLSHNDSPPVKGLGSAVFIHVVQPDDRDTLGCVAFAPEDMTKLLPHLQADMPVTFYA